mmetsp:Transcript_8263/g.32628  ORF Transcript_8263/g.32628 Transcript_8263/m.32628 type:complete len:213 (+) Transcript_8263:406-1044(+)
MRGGEAPHRPVRGDVHDPLRSPVRSGEAAHRPRGHAAPDEEGRRGDGRVHRHGQASRVPPHRERRRERLRPVRHRRRRRRRRIGRVKLRRAHDDGAEGRVFVQGVRPPGARGVHVPVRGAHGRVHGGGEEGVQVAGGREARQGIGGGRRGGGFGRVPGGRIHRGGPRRRRHSWRRLALPRAERAELLLRRGGPEEEARDGVVPRVPAVLVAG